MQLTLDDATTGGKSIDSPSWPEVEAAIRSMDNNNRTEVGLFVDDNTYLQVGGGADTYICSIRAEGKLHVLFDPSRTASEEKWVIAGQGSHQPTNECFSISTIIDVAKWFWEHRTPCSQYHWNSY